PEVELSLDNIAAINRDAHSPRQKIKISIIMPVFNAATWVRTAIVSLLNQTWQNLEIIVIDDASTDNTVNEISKLAYDDSRIILLTQKKNLGAYSARNLGLRQATGEYVTNHDSDDWSHPE